MNSPLQFDSVFVFVYHFIKLCLVHSADLVQLYKALDISRGPFGYAGDFHFASCSGRHASSDEYNQVVRPWIAVKFHSPQTSSRDPRSESKSCEKPSVLSAQVSLLQRLLHVLLRILPL